MAVAVACSEWPDDQVPGSPRSIVRIVRLATGLSTYVGRVTGSGSHSDSPSAVCIDADADARLLELLRRRDVARRLGRRGVRRRRRRSVFVAPCEASTRVAGRRMTLRGLGLRVGDLVPVGLAGHAAPGGGPAAGSRRSARPGPRPTTAAGDRRPRRPPSRPGSRETSTTSDPASPGSRRLQRGPARTSARLCRLGRPSAASDGVSTRSTVRGGVTTIRSSVTTRGATSTRIGGREPLDRVACGPPGRGAAAPCGTRYTAHATTTSCVDHSGQTHGNDRMAASAARGRQRGRCVA